MTEQWEVSLNLGEKIPGKELLKLLLAIDRTGSLNRAVQEAGMSYRYGWGLLNRAEKTLGLQLVLRQVGGLAGGGTSLTEDGKKVLGHLQSLQREVQGQIESLIFPDHSSAGKQLLLASTMEPVVTGLLDVLAQAYMNETGVAVRHIAAGSGQALSLARAGRVDLVLTHAPELEEEFLAQGYGIWRLPVMYNEFVLVGPADDPAKVKNLDIKSAFLAIAKRKMPFVSRGDNSGTNLMEQKIWKAVNVNPDGEEWYHKCNSVYGSFEALRRAEMMGAYTIVDRASFLAANLSGKLAVLTMGGDDLKNVFSVIPVSRTKAAVNQEQAEAFSRWLAGPKAAGIIRDFGRQYYGQALFTPLNGKD